MWHDVDVCRVLVRSDAAHVRTALRTVRGQVAIEVVRGADGVQYLDVMARHVQVAEREVLFECISTSICAAGA